MFGVGIALKTRLCHRIPRIRTQKPEVASDHLWGPGGRLNSSNPQSLELIEGRPSDDFPTGCLRVVGLAGGDLGGG